MRKRNENDESVFLTAIAAGNDYCYKTDDFLTLFDENLRSDRSPILYAILNNRPDAIDAILDFARRKKRTKYFYRLLYQRHNDKNLIFYVPPEWKTKLDTMIKDGLKEIVQNNWNDDDEIHDLVQNYFSDDEYN